MAGGGVDLQAAGIVDEHAFRRGAAIDVRQGEDGIAASVGEDEALALASEGDRVGARGVVIDECADEGGDCGSVELAAKGGGVVGDEHRPGRGRERGGHAIGRDADGAESARAGIDDDDAVSHGVRPCTRD